jgi:hypothetical protein
LGARSAFALCIVPWARCRSPAHITVVSQCKDAEEKSENQYSRSGSAAAKRTVPHLNAG